MIAGTMNSRVLTDRASRSATGNRNRVLLKVGFYGCANGVVRVRMVEPPQNGQLYPQRVRLHCPGCGHEHDASIGWRPYNPKIDDPKNDLVVWIPN
jgi:hypothetical protein